MTADVHTLAGAYAVHALPVEEQQFFERHLDVCEACNVEVDEFLATAAVLGGASAETAPPLMRQRTLSAVDVTRQAPPVSQAPAPARRSGRRVAETLLASVAAALALALLVLSGVTVHLNERVVELEAAGPTAVDDRALAVLAAPDAETRPMGGGGLTSGRFVYSPDLDTGVFVAHGLQPLPAASTYELWLFHDGTPHPATVFDPDGEGRAFAIVEGAVAGAEFAAVTVEPHGGSPAPTGEVVIEGSV